jgi:N-acetylglucosamine-6-phosphate deacetylase
VDAGARMSTHLGNGAHPTIRRHPNYIWDQLAEDRLTASLIVDGHHLPPAVVKSMIRAKTPERIVLVSDITSMGGMPPGRYQTGLGELEVLPSGKLVPAGQPGILAGASLPIHACVANVMRLGGVTLAQAIDMASRRPAQLIGLARPGLEIGAIADLCLFDLPALPEQSLQIRATYHRGIQS